MLAKIQKKTHTHISNDICEQNRTNKQNQRQLFNWCFETNPKTNLNCINPLNYLFIEIPIKSPQYPQNTHIRIRYIFNVVILRAKFQIKKKQKQKCKFIDHNMCCLCSVSVGPSTGWFRNVYVNAHLTTGPKTYVDLLFVHRSSNESIGRIGRQC